MVSACQQKKNHKKIIGESFPAYDFGMPFAHGRIDK
jgi:hypothetical protein